MDGRSTYRRRAPTVTSMSSDISEEPIAEVDEPPDDVKGPFWSSSSHLRSGYIRPPPKVDRRESLLTRQIQSETEHTDQDEPKSPIRALSTQSTWSSISMPSTAELTSDDGHSVPSTAGSPPLPAAQIHPNVPVAEKPVDAKVKIVGSEETPAVVNGASTSEQSVEANLGRKRCITFACKNKQEAKPVEPAPAPAQPESTSPPKRKCMLKFVCPSRAEADRKAAEKVAAEKTETTKRPISPPPLERKPSTGVKHRGSDSTLTHLSPKQTRKASTAEKDTDETKPLEVAPLERRYSNESNEDSGTDETRFHEFANSENEHENWTQMATCYRSRLTVDDTLKKEHVIRKTCEEVEEEALEEEAEEEEEEELDELEAVADMDDEENVEDGDEEDEDTDEGFHSDDEDGFANSDSEEDDDSDFEWWKPGGLSTAATSVEQLDRLAFINSQQTLPGTSAGSASSGHLSPFASKTSLRKVRSKNSRTSAVNINRPASPDLPDSTDFVCGTLDEDRPLEQAFVNRRKQKEAAKAGFKPQDIDPTFPTSDPEMDDEDDEEDGLVEPSMGEEDGMMHGNLEGIDGDGTARRRSLVAKPTARSPPPAALRLRSPPPPKQRLPSPPPPTRRTMARSPAPPRKLFSRSPNKIKSPAPMKPMTSPPNSPVSRTTTNTLAPTGLAGRPQLTHTSSLPRGGATTTLSKLAPIPSDDEASDNNTRANEIPKRGAIDIVKGLEKKRQFRKRKLAQKANAKVAAEGRERSYKVRPGMGCERMREVGLALKEWHGEGNGRAEHILSL